MRARAGKPDLPLPADSPTEQSLSPASRPLDVLFVMGSLRPLRHFQSTLELLTERGHNVRLLLEERRRRKSPRQWRWVEQMTEQPNFVCEVVKDVRNDPWQARKKALREGMACVHFLGPIYGGRSRYAFRGANRGAAGAIRRVAQLPLIRTRRGLRSLYRVLATIDRALPIPASATENVQRLQPDIVVATVRRSAAVSSTYTKVAKKLGIPALTCVASWDNMTTRGHMLDLPHVLTVWNQTHAQEAVEIHGVPAERVVVTGAPSFDEWFSWQPRPRREFLERVGVDPARRVLLWVGSALNRWEPREAALVLRWLEALRSSTERELREVGVLLRPHPLRAEHWTDLDVAGFENVVIWPRADMTMPVDDEQKADYYDSIFHSRAVVGINSSAMIEASIVGRPVLSVLDPAYHDSQLGALHFSYLLEPDSRVLRLARSMDEHLADLRAILASGDDEAVAAARRFVARFVRPHGLDRPATPRLVETIEQVARLPVEPERDPFWVVAARALIVLPGRLTSFLTSPRGATGRRVERIRRSFGVAGAAATNGARARHIRRFFRALAETGAGRAR